MTPVRLPERDRTHQGEVHRPGPCSHHASGWDWQGSSATTLNEQLELHARSAQQIAHWYAVTTQALDRLVHHAPAFSAASLVQLWPEHFDAALDMAFDPEAPTERRVNMGGSPGDGFHTAPYLHVGPRTPGRDRWPRAHTVDRTGKRSGRTTRVAPGPRAR